MHPVSRAGAARGHGHPRRGVQDWAADGRLLPGRCAGARPQHLAAGPLRHVAALRSGGGRGQGGAARWRSDAALRRSLRGDQRRQAQRGARPQDTDGPRAGRGARHRGRRARGGVPPRGHGPARARRIPPATGELRARVLLHLRLRPGGGSGPGPRPRRQLPGVVGRTRAGGGPGDDASPPRGRPGGRHERRLRGVRRAGGQDDDRSRRPTRHLHDRRALDLDGTRRPYSRGHRTDDRARLRALRDGGRPPGVPRGGRRGALLGGAVHRVGTPGPGRLGVRGADRGR